MKSVHQEASLVCVLTATLGLIMIGQVTAQTFTTLYSFTTPSNPPPYGNIDGDRPYGELILSGNALFGTAVGGGSAGNGTVFKLNRDGTGFANLHIFTATANNGYNFLTNSDGVNPPARLLLSGSTLYGTANAGGSSGNGTVFAINTNGTGFMTIYSFTATYGPPDYINSDGATPVAGLLLSGNTLYGTAFEGGTSGNGTVFAVNTDGTGFTNLHNFTASSGPYPPTNSDGANPSCVLVLFSNTLYGTDYHGGTSGNGTVFAVNTDGTGFTNLHSFTAVTFGTNSDGARPFAGLLLSGNTLYGTAYYGGSGGSGTMFALNTDGTGFTNLHNFSATHTNSSGGYTNSDGVAPNGLILSGNTLYGTANGGGSSGDGTVFALRTDGAGFTTLHSFTARAQLPSCCYANSDGANPFAGLLLSGNTLYGTAYDGGSGGSGTVFSLSFTPQLTIIPSGTNVILTWPTNYAGFDYTGYRLQSATNLGTSAIWTTNLPPPVVVNGQYTVTNPIAGRQQFYRLSQ